MIQTKKATANTIEVGVWGLGASIRAIIQQTTGWSLKTEASRTQDAPHAYQGIVKYMESWWTSFLDCRYEEPPPLRFRRWCLWMSEAYVSQQKRDLKLTRNAWIDVESYQYFIYVLFSKYAIGHEVDKEVVWHIKILREHDEIPPDYISLSLIHVELLAEPSRKIVGDVDRIHGFCVWNDNLSTLFSIGHRPQASLNFWLSNLKNNKGSHYQTGKVRYTQIR